MTEVLVPLPEQAWKQPPAETGAPLMTPVGVIEGDVLAMLERDGATTLRRLIRELEWPAPLVMMAVGALIREGLVTAIQRELEVRVELLSHRSAPVGEAATREPHVFG